jgi:hypothetical protein
MPPSKKPRAKRPLAKKAATTQRTRVKPAAARKRAAKKRPPLKVASSHAPFDVHDLLASQWNDVRLSFHDWEWLERTHGSIEIDGYYMNGPGVEGLVRAVMVTNNLDPDAAGIDYDSEGDACHIHFKSLALANQVAALANAMIGDRAKLADAIEVARELGFED